jgi:hypothetical protein
MVSAWNRAAQCHYGTQFVIAGNDNAAQRRRPGIACNSCKRGCVAILFRTAFIAGLGVLLVLPVLAMNNSIDRMLPHDRALGQGSMSAWLDQFDDAAGRAMIRLEGLKSEIHADMCRRGSQRYCFGDACLTLPRDGCGQS